MKLYFAPGACSLSPHIVSRELGIPVELKKVNNKDKTIEGGGDAHAFDFARRDVFVVPSWHAFTLSADEDSVLFSFSDRPVQEVLGLWREERLA